MSRKHFEIIACAMREADPGSDSSVRGGWMCAVNRLADTFGAMNPRFGRARFLKACGL
jgi:hypothetical protein